MTGPPWVQAELQKQVGPHSLEQGPHSYVGTLPSKIGEEGT